jgi:hypothetical protein
MVPDVVKRELPPEQPLRDQCVMVLVRVDVADWKNENSRNENGEYIEPNE